MLALTLKLTLIHIRERAQRAQRLSEVRAYKMHHINVYAHIVVMGGYRFEAPQAAPQ